MLSKRLIYERLGKNTDTRSRLRLACSRKQKARWRISIENRSLFRKMEILELKTKITS